MEPTAAQYSGGTGAPNDPYQIATAADLIALGNEPNDYDKHFVLIADIDLDPNLPGRQVFGKAVIAPITPTDVAPYWQGTPFAGVVDGNGHVILRLTIVGWGYLGLFGELAPEAEVKNLGLMDVNITGAQFVGAVAGANGGRVSTCCSTGVLREAMDVGGLVGWNLGIISDCYSMASVSGEDTVGGLVGYSGYDPDGYHDQPVPDVQLIRCYSAGAVGGDAQVGGLVGESEHCRVIDCFWDMGASGQPSSAAGVGKTTAEMQMGETFIDAGWDFVCEIANGIEDIWWIFEGSDYPRLWWEVAGDPDGAAE